MDSRRYGVGNLVLALLAIALTLPTSRLAGSEISDLPWVAGPFQSSAAELLRAADVALADAGPLAADAAAVVLYHDAAYTFDAAGRAVFRRHWVYRVQHESAVAEWSTLELRWSPWHQSLPTIEARVVAADGGVSRLLSAHVEEKAERRGRPDERPAGRADPDRRRWLLARLPNVAAGAVVEVLTEVRDLGPAFDSGVAQRHYFVMFVPVLDSRLTLDVSKRLPLRYFVRTPSAASGEPASPIEQRSEQTDERFRLHLRARHLPAAGVTPEGLPGRVSRYLHAAFATGRDWQSVASRYHHLVERVLHPDLAALDPDFGARLDAIVRTHESAEDRVDRVLAAVRARVVHDGSELEATPPGPRRLSEILAAGSGNAVDLAALTLAALRRVGIAAHAALLDAGFGIDSEPGLPGLGSFNHVVVFVPAQTVVQGPVATESLPALWLDPGAPFARAGELPLVDQGRLTLVAARDTAELVELPTTTPEDNLAHERRDVLLREWGAADLVESSRFAGSAEQTQRAVTHGLDDDARRRGYLAYARAFHGATGLGRIEESRADVLSKEFRLSLEIQGVATAVTELDHARVLIPVAELGRRLPQVFRAPLAEPRRDEFVFHEPFLAEWQYVIHPPSGFVVGELPPDEDLALGPGSYRHSFRAVGDEDTGRELIHGSLRFSVGQRRVTADQFERMHAAVRDFLQRPPLEVELVPAAQRTDDALEHARLLTSWVTREPAGAAHRVRLARALLDLGLSVAAREQARAAIDLAPTWPLGPWALGLALAHDDLGRFAAPGADLEAARRQLSAARRLAPDDPRPIEALVRLDRTQQAGPTDTERLQSATADVADLGHPDDPKTPLYRLLAGELESAQAQAALHPRERLRLRRDGLRDYASLLRAVTQPAAVAVSGAPHLGYRLDLAPAGGEGKLFVTQGEGELLVAAIDRAPASLGREAVERLWLGDLAGARRWLDWAVESSHPRKHAPNREIASFRELWPLGDDETLHADALRLAAAALAASVDLGGRGLEWLRAAVDRGEGIAPLGAGVSESQAAVRRRAAQVAHVEALLASGDGRAAAARLQTLAAAAQARDERVAELEMKLRIELGDWQGVEQLVVSSDDGERPPERRSAMAVRALAAARAARGEHGEAAGLWLLLHKRGELLDDDALRWAGMLLQPEVAAASSDLAVLVRHARMAADPRLLGRTAALLAAAGRGDEAHALLLRAAGSGGVYLLGPAEVWVKARIAESVGLVDTARRTYAELVAATADAAEPLDEDRVLFRRLAQAQLARLSFG